VRQAVLLIYGVCFLLGAAAYWLSRSEISHQHLAKLL